VEQAGEQQQQQTKQGKTEEQGGADAVAEAFALLDRNGDGSLSRAEVIKGLRAQPAVRALLGLGAVVRQEDGTRDAFEAVYQAIDRDGSKAIDLPELRRYLGGSPSAALPVEPARPRGGRPPFKSDLLCNFVGQSTGCTPLQLRLR
jgi:Ca2+-binding EF-hand superfamily protein